MPTSDHQLVHRLLTICEGLDGAEIADAIDVTPSVVSRWLNGKQVKYLRKSTRERIKAILAQPGWKYVPSRVPTEREEASTAEKNAYAAGVLWAIAEGAEHIAKKAREAHAFLRSAGAMPPSLDEVEDGARSLEAGRQLLDQRERSAGRATRKGGRRAG